jgi:uncharacterized protein (DUF427 family)
MVKIEIRPAGVRVRVTFNSEVIGESADALLLEEDAHPPVYYLPRKDVKMERLIRTSYTTHCPHKGDATHYSVCNGRTARNAVWSYEKPHGGVAAIRERLAFYPNQVTIEVNI